MDVQAQEAAGRAQGCKRRRRQEDVADDGEWRRCAVGEYRAGCVRVVAGARVVRLAEVVAGRRRTEKRRRETSQKCRLKVVCIDKRCRLLVRESNSFDGGRSERSDDSLGAESGLSGEEEDRQRVVRKQDERKVEVAESRRGYVRGAVWDEGNMIQAMARLKNPTIAWRYGDGWSLNL